MPDEFNEYEDKKEESSAGGEPSDAEHEMPALVGGGDPDNKRYCPHCGHIENDDGARFCRYCGTLLTKTKPSGWINDFFTGEKEY